MIAGILFWVVWFWWVFVIYFGLGLDRFGDCRFMVGWVCLLVEFSCVGCWWWVLVFGSEACVWGGVSGVFWFGNLGLLF